MTLSYNHTNKDGTKNYYYICTGKKKYGVQYCNSKNINNWILDDYVLNKIKHKDFKKVQHQNNDFDKIEKIEKRIKSNSKKIEKLVNNLLDVGNEAGKVINRKLKELSEENDRYKKDLWILNNNKPASSDISIETVIQLIDGVDHEGKRDLVSAIIDEIIWNSNLQHPNDITITPK